MPNEVIDINFTKLGAGMKTKSSIAKILDNLHFFRNLTKSANQYENYIKYVKISLIIFVKNHLILKIIV